MIERSTGAGAVSAPAPVTVLAGPTAVGKGTVSAAIRARYPQIWLSVSATTRSPRRAILTAALWLRLPLRQYT